MLMRSLTVTALLMGAPALADGDAAKGEKGFKRCKACHVIKADDGTVIKKGGKTGPNLYGVLGRPAGSVEGFRYSSVMTAAAEAGLVWDEANLAEFLKDPSKHLAEVSGKKGRSKMSLKLKKGREDMVAYLKSVGPAPAEDSTEDASEDSSAQTD